jgi:hypothetical protein
MPGGVRGRPSLVIDCSLCYRAASGAEVPNLGPKGHKSSYGLGAVFRRLDEKCAQSKLQVTQAQKLGYAYTSW